MNEWTLPAMVGILTIINVVQTWIMASRRAGEEKGQKEGSANAQLSLHEYRLGQLEAGFKTISEQLRVLPTIEADMRAIRDGLTLVHEDGTVTRMRGHDILGALSAIQMTGEAEAMRNKKVAELKIKFDEQDQKRGQKK